MSTTETIQDPRDVQIVQDAPPALEAFNRADVLGPADVHTAVTLGRVLGDDRPQVLLAAALAVRGPRFGHVRTDLRTVRDTVTTEDASPADLPGWPDPDQWVATLADSPLVSGPDRAGDAPLVLDGHHLYLDRYWRYERQVADELTRRAGATVEDVDLGVLRAGLDRLFPATEGVGSDAQRQAAATAVLRRLTVIAGGPGTGKTTTVSRLLALLIEQADARGGRPPRVALAAPTGKAATRLREALLEAVADRVDTSDEVLARLAESEPATIHRLLGRHPGSRTRFRHDRSTPLPHDVVVVDETSMVSLSLMAKLLEAVRRDARLVLVGDPGQLASVEAGAVLGDVVGPAADRPRRSAAAHTRLAEATGLPLSEDGPSPGPAGIAAEVPPIADGIVVLSSVHRFRRDSGIAALATALAAGDVEQAMAVLRGGHDDVRWHPATDPAAYDATLAPVRRRLAESGRRLVAAARAGQDADALAELSRIRVLCAHRRGAVGVAAWNPRVERWWADDVDGFAPGPGWYVGRPVIVTRNDYRLGVFNGDVGVTVRAGHGTDGEDTVAVAFEAEDGPRRVAPSRLDHVETVHAMTVHKSQGSQFDEVVVALPDASSPILTRELLYTAVTRARSSLTVVGGEDAIRAAIGRRIQRASGLREALWAR